MTKLDKELLNKRKERLKQIMSDYNLKNQDVALLTQNSYAKVKNWKYGSTFFTTSDEYYLLQMIKKHRPAYEKQALREIWTLEL